MYDEMKAMCCVAPVEKDAIIKRYRRKAVRCEMCEMADMLGFIVGVAFIIGMMLLIREIRKRGAE